jgi:hypothetical protein
MGWINQLPTDHTKEFVIRRLHDGMDGTMPIPWSNRVVSALVV